MSEPKTPYRHRKSDEQLWNLAHAMDYNAAGEPVLRTMGSGSAGSKNNGAYDAFGRARVSQPFTMFDSQLRYSKREDQYSEQLTGSASTVYNINESSLSLTVTNAAGDKAVRESLRVFMYQPGKSLQILTSFKFDEGQNGLSQRVGYFNNQNGIFFANIDGVNCVIRRSYVTGSAVDTVVPQSEWNTDKLDGTTLTGITLDSSKAQIFFVELEWLGTGQVRAGFVIAGNYYVCHVFNHANVIESTYMTTACLPVRFEIENTAATVASSTMKQICATVISEGGYEISGTKYAVARELNTPVDITSAGTYYPVVSLRLKSDRLDGIAVLTQIDALGIVNSGRFIFAVVKNATVTGGSWVGVTNSAIEYNANATTISGGEVIAQSLSAVTNQSASSISLDGDAFGFQFERDGLTDTAYTYTLAVTSNVNGADAVGSMSWEERF